MKRLETQRLSWNRSSSHCATGSLRLAGVLAAAVSASYVPTVSAQDANLVLEEIVVTVRRRVEMEQDVPISMKAMDAEFIRQQNITQLDDLGIKVPAVRISNAGASTSEPIVAVRGQRPTDTTLGLDQAAPIYMNEVVLTPSQGGNIGLYDLENIQILKGPQGTLFGRNSTGGAILISTKRPGLDFGGYGQVELGNYNLRAFEGAVDLPVNDTMQFRLATRMVKRDGYQDNVADNDLAGDEKFWDEDSKALRATMNLDLGRVTNVAVLSYDENDMASRVPVFSGFNSGAIAARGGFGTIHNTAGVSGTNIDDALARQQSRDVHEIETDVDGFEKVENVNFANITEFEITDSLSFKSVLGYRKVDYENAADADGTALPLFGVVTPDSFDDPAAFSFGNVDYSDNITTDPDPTVTVGEQYSIELQLFGDAFDGDLEWIAGVYAYKMDASISGTTQVTGALPGYPGGLYPSGPLAGNLDEQATYGRAQRSPEGDVLNEAQAIFGEGTYTFSDQFSLTVGLRQTWDQREVTVRNQSNNVGFSGNFGIDNLECSVQKKGGGAAPNCSRTESEDYSSPTGRISANYTPLDGMLAYFSISTGYRAGGFNLRGNTDESLAPFDEETVVTYELGHKADWGLLGYAPLRTNVAIYQQDYEDIQKTTSFIDSTTGTFGTNTVNAAEAVIRGVEFDITWAITENFRASFAYAWTDAYYKEWTVDIIDTRVPGSAAVAQADASEGDFTYIPENSANITLAYDIPVDLSLGEMTLSLVGYWQSAMATHATGNLFDEKCGSDNPGYACYNSWTDPQIEAAQDTVEADAYDVWNFKYDWRNIFESNIDAALWVNNLTDEEYVLGGLNVVDTLGLAAATYGAPRTFGVNVRYNF